jgi:anti-sigma B factor antagonist
MGIMISCGGKHCPSMTRLRPTCCAEARRTRAEAPGGATAQVAPRSAPLAIDGRRVGSRVILTVRGEVDISNADEFRHALESAGDTRAAEIWLDLTAASFFDCRGVRALLDLRAGLLDGHRRLVLICPPGPVRRLLVLTGADRELEIHSTAAAARRPWRSGTVRETRGGACRR